MPSGVEDNFEILSHAVTRNAGNVISLPSAGLVRHFKSRFIGEIDEGIWLEAVAPALPMLLSIINDQQLIAVTFKGSELRLSFTATPIRVDSHFPINSTTTLPAVLVGHPVEVKGIQRRAAYRVRVPEDFGLAVRIWSISEQAEIIDAPPGTHEIEIRLRDLSIGGIGILVPNFTSRRLVPFQRLRIEFHYEDLQIVMEGRLRVGAISPTGTMSGGIMLEKLENDMDGRKKLAALTRIVGQLQRQEVRRAKFGSPV